MATPINSSGSSGRRPGSGQPFRRRHDAPRPDVDWIVNASDERSLARYLTAAWAGRWIVLVAIISALAGAVLYLSTASKVYEAHSQLLVTPLPSSTATSGLGLIQQSADPLRDVETAAGFVTTTSVAQRVVSVLHLREPPTTALSQIKIAPIAESNIVDIGARGSTPAAAQRLANAFASQTIAYRTASLYRQLDTMIPRLQAQLQAHSDGATRTALSTQLGQLEQLRVAPDPDMKVATLATLPTSPASPRRSLTIAAALVGGLVVGLGLVFLIQLLRPRVRREEDLRERFRLPILARIPRIGNRSWRRRRGGPIPPDAITPEGTDAFRALRSVLLSGREPGGRGRIVLVTGGSPLDGKSTTSINLSAALASSGDRVILIEGDNRRPSIGAALNLGGPSNGLVTMNAEMPQLRMLLASANGNSSHVRSPSAWPRLLAAARRSADWVVVDAPPLIYAPDVLEGADEFDDVLLVVRVGNTDARNLDETAEMLAHHGLRPTGLVLVGTSGHRAYY